MTKEQKETFAHNARAIRKSILLTQEAFAEVVGVKRSNIAIYENAIATPKIEVLAEYEALSGLTLKELIEERMSTEFFVGQSSVLTRREKAFYRMFIEEINTLRSELGLKLVMFKH